MNILLLAPHPFYQARGTPIAEKALIEVLTGAGHRVDVLTFHEGEDLPIPGCTIYRVPRLPGLSGVRPGFSGKKLVGDALLFFSCLRRVRRHRYDAIHAVEESAFIAAAVQRLFGIPFIYDMDSSLAQQMVEKFPGLVRIERLLEACEGVAVRQSVGVIAVCKALEETVRSHDPAKLVARVEDTSLLAPADGLEVERIREQGDGPIALYVGNLEEYQGIDLLLEGFVHSVRGVPDARLVIVGGDERSIAHYRQRAERLGIAGQVRFLGPRPIEMLGDLLEQADVLLSPRTKGQNTPMKIYSYLDAGRALLATRLPTHTQVLDDEISLLVEPEPAAMGAGLTRLLRDGELRRRLAAAARERVRQEYSAEAHRRKILAFYDAVERSLVARAAPSPREPAGERTRAVEGVAR